MKTLYVSDLDGTLLNKDSQLSDYSIDLINKLINKGVLFTFATARSLTAAKDVTKGLKIKLPVIVFNGAFIIDLESNEKIHSAFFNKDENKLLKDCFLKYSLNPLVYSYINDTERVSWIIDKETDMIKKYKEKRKNDKRMRPINDIEELYTGDIFQYTFIEPKDTMIDAYEYLNRLNNFSINFQKELYQDEYLFEINNKMATKGNAVLKLKDILKIEKVVVFGDTKGDVSMFEISDECYAVDNAMEELKKYAKGIICSNENNGVAKWLENNVEI